MIGLQGRKVEKIQIQTTNSNSKFIKKPPVHFAQEVFFISYFQNPITSHKYRLSVVPFLVPRTQWKIHF